MVMVNQTNTIISIGVDIGGTKTLIIIGDEQGRIIFKERVVSTGDLGLLVNRVKVALAKAELTDGNLLGMGIGVPGRVDSRSGFVIDVPSLKWQQLQLREIFQNEFRLPVFVNNDVNLAAYGERWLGYGKGSDNLFYLAIGTGIGGAIIANGMLIEGAGFSAGEIGYFIDREAARQGYRGVNQEFGALEKRSSGSALNQKGLKLGLTAPELFQEYQNGNSNVDSMLDEFIIDIAVAIANVASLLNPEVVIIGGGVSESMSVVIDEIRRQVAEYSPIPVQIVLSNLGGEAGALGGLAYVFQKTGVLKN